MKRKPETPMLDGLIACGLARTDGTTFEVCASDGVWLIVGCVWEPKDLANIESWLREFPDPTKW